MNDDDLSAGQDSAAPDESPEADDPRIARRDALKKAAVGTAVAGAVWVAPRVDGLSLVPDYASAGTASTGNIKFVIEATDSYDNNNYYSNNDRNNWGGLNGCGLGPNDYLVAVQPKNPGISISPLPNTTQRSAITMTAPLGAAGNAVTTVPNGADGDLENTIDINVAFNIDPPWNKCRINAVSFNKCAPGSNSPGDYSIINNPGAGATNPAPFTATVRVPSQPRNWEKMEITVKCD